MDSAIRASILFLHLIFLISTSYVKELGVLREVKIGWLETLHVGQACAALTLPVVSILHIPTTRLHFQVQFGFQ